MKNILLISVFILALNGCYVISLHPSYLKTDIKFAKTLVGTWQDTTSNVGYELFEIEKNDSSGFSMTCIANEKKGKFIMHSFKIRDNNFLDVYPTDDMLDFFGPYIITGHLILHYKLIVDKLFIYMLNFEKIDSLDNKEISIIPVSNTNKLINSETPQIRDFILKQFDKGLFDDFPVGVFKKVKR